MRRGAWLVALAAALALAACTRVAYEHVALVYRNAESLLAWTVDDYVDLSREQKAWVRERLAAQLAWHRASELPRYRRFLSAAGQRLLERPGAEDVCAGYEEAHGYYLRTVEHVIPDVTDFLVTLDGAQLAHLERRFAEENRKLVKEAAHGTADERRAEAVKRTLRHLEQWTGTLTREQRELVARHRAGVPEMLQDRLADRRYRQMEFLALARSRDRERIVRGLHALLVETDAWRRPAYREKLQASQAAACSMVAQLAASLTPTQRKHLQERVDEYLGDMARLIAAG